MTRKTIDAFGLLILGLAGILAVIVLGIAFDVPRPVHASEQTVIAKKLIDTKSAISTTAATGIIGTARSCAVYADWSAGVTTGVVTVETAVDQNYAGTWAALTGGTLTFANTAPNQNVVLISNVLWALRTRISTGVVGGTVNTWIVCN